MAKVQHYMGLDTDLEKLYNSIKAEIENEKAVAETGIIDPAEFSNYRLWQRGGEIAAGTILGTSIAALFGIVFAYSRKSIPGSSNKRKALILDGIIWFVIFLVPALKYPANPPAVGDPETIYYRQSLYLAYALSESIPMLVPIPMLRIRQTFKNTLTEWAH